MPGGCYRLSGKHGGGLNWQASRLGIMKAISMLSRPQQVQSALSAHWSPIYSKKVVGLGAAQLLLADYGVRNADLIAKFASCQLPKKDRFVAIIKKVKDSATGPNGIPYSAYAACIDTSAQILENTTELFGEEAEPGHSKAD